MTRTCGFSRSWTPRWPTTTRCRSFRRSPAGDALLSEDQIQLYARQILLKPVGGRGQEKLCAQEAVVSGEGLAVEVACEYLAAGGTRFSRVAKEGGRHGRVRAATQSPTTAEKAPASLTEVLIGSELHWSDCPDCLARAAASVTAVSGDCAILTGTLAALIFQRLILDLGPTRGGLRVHPDGTITDAPPIVCEAHR